MRNFKLSLLPFISDAFAFAVLGVSVAVVIILGMAVLPGDAHEASLYQSVTTLRFRPL